MNILKYVGMYLLAAIVLLILLTMVVWPTAFFEDIAVYSDMIDYVYDVTNNKESSES